MDDIQRCGEKQKINDLLAEYTLTIDRHDIEAWANCFTTEGEFGFGNRTIRGRAKIREYGKVHSTITARHLTVSPFYTLDSTGDRATGQSTTIVLVATRQGHKVAFFGRYDDELCKVDGKWLIARRWVTEEPIPDDPSCNVLAADPDVAKAVRPLLDAYERLGDEV